MQAVNIGILGLGTVGGGTAQVLQDNAAEISRRLGREVRVTAVCTRNTAFIRRAGSIEFAPVYDFAPMKADPEGIIRSTTWGAPLENGGEYDFSAIAQSFADLADPDALLAELQSTAAKLLDLKHNLRQRGVPSRILEMAGLGYDYLPEKFQRWGLL